MKKSKLFNNFKIKDIVFRNRIVLSPMCQYKAVNGFLMIGIFSIIQDLHFLVWVLLTLLYRCMVMKVE